MTPVKEVMIKEDTLDIRIPKQIIEIFKGEPRVIFKKLEWYGLHPLPLDLFPRELKEAFKDYTIIAVPNEMIR